MKTNPSSQLKNANIKSVLAFVYHRHKTSKQEIADALNLSRPTVQLILKELTERDLIEQNGHFDSTGGRKPDALLFKHRSRIAIGVELLKTSYEIVAIDLYGSTVRSEKHLQNFSNSQAYIQKVCGSINAFIDALDGGPERILGVNIVLQGLISSDGTTVTYGKILNCTGLTIDRFKEYLDYPCGMIHDGEAAATQELWFSPAIQNAIFFHIRWNMSGALIVNGKFLKGNELKSGVFEHMTIVPGGRACYCGKQGCVDSYCSINALLHPSETMEVFFSALRTGNAAQVRRWQAYLEHLSTAIDNLHMMIDYDVILGGILGRYLIPADIDALHRLIAGKTAFPTSRKYIHISSSAGTPIATGAALPHVIGYLGL